MPHSWSHCFSKYTRVLKQVIGGIALFAVCQQSMAIHPSLVDLGVNETKVLEFTTGNEYLFVIHNENAHSTRFYFGDFAQSVFTRSMQGAAGVAQDSVDVPANGKVLWLFSPGKEGEYSYYAVNGSSEQKGARGKMIVKLAESTNEVTQAAQTPVENSASKTSEKSENSEKDEKLAVTEQRRWLKGGRRD